MRNLLIEIEIEDEGMEEVPDLNLYHDPNAPRRIISIKRNFITRKKFTTVYDSVHGAVKIQHFPFEEKNPLEEIVEERKCNHLRMVNQRLNGNYETCMHDNCPSCWGTGVTSNGTPCLHGLVCHCPKCSARY